MSYKKDMIYISIIVFLLAIGYLVYRENREVQLDYYVEQNLIVRGDFGMEAEYYHPAVNPNNYCFENTLFKACFRKHQ